MAKTFYFLRAINATSALTKLNGITTIYYDKMCGQPIQFQDHIKLAGDNKNKLALNSALPMQLNHHNMHRLPPLFLPKSTHM